MTSSTSGDGGVRKISRATQILLGLLFGAVAGVAVNLATGGGPAAERSVTVLEPIGRIWLNALIMVVIPLIVATLPVGVAGLGSLKRLGRIGVITFLVFLSLTALATAVGLVVVNLVRPGDGLDAEVRTRLLETYRDRSADMALGADAFGVDLLVAMVPRNPVKAAAEGQMLALIVFSLLLGVGLTSIARERAAPLLGVLESLGHVTIAIIDLVMRVAPVGVFCLIFSVTARFGLDLMASLLQYVLTVLGGLLLFCVLVYPVLLKLLARRSPLVFFRDAGVVLVTAFSTSSSNATLPTTLRVSEEKLGVAPQIARFVIPLGATMNMNGTALFEGITVLFVAQVFGVELALGAQLAVLLLAVLTAVGAAGVPGGSIPLLMMVLGVVGVPMEGIAIVLGVDRILDMSRTVLNVTGDMVTATIVDRFEGRALAAG